MGQFKAFYWASGQRIWKKRCPDCKVRWIGLKASFCKHCKQIGERNHFYGKHHSEVFLKRRSEEQKQRCSDPTKNPNWQGGLVQKAKICSICGGNKSYSNSRMCKKCCSNLHRGDANPSRRPEVKKKLSLMRLREKNPSWKGGIGRLPYPVSFDKALKEYIKKRDSYECQLCHVEPRLAIHHIDYNKWNCVERNLITLCKRCNPRVNENRDYWFAYFTYILEEKYESGEYKETLKEISKTLYSA